MDPYAVLAVAAAGWDRLAGRLAEPTRERLAALLAVVRGHHGDIRGDHHGDTRARDDAAAEAAGLLREALPGEFGPGAESRLAGAPPGTPPAYQGFHAEDLAVLVLDGHRMVGPVLGPVRERLLAAPALDADALLRRGGDPQAPGLIRLPGPGGRARLPRFQFSEDTLPWLVVLEVNALLDAAHDPWGAADWWLSPNAWLGGAPAALLGTGRDPHLVDIARFLMEEE
ncbi:hypothetical protein WN71_025450 [Streptomyces mangrovisoli]|uniref:Uncharacterized protein n=1 Tax=Streptomyces mangrovisoli TaxID=1428628 RepID=A0A1J4NS59_9ACTN|nr:hypothetical protein [Streptomyces mangrovisoli]OIJ65155.1 hypothetical protein WN71_025450 [Streptomyces mangrovisoli]